MLRLFLVLVGCFLVWDVGDACASVSYFLLRSGLNSLIFWFALGDYSLRLVPWIFIRSICLVSVYSSFIGLISLSLANLTGSEGGTSSGWTSFSCTFSTTSRLFPVSMTRFCGLELLMGSGCCRWSISSISWTSFWSIRSPSGESLISGIV